jgi:hypothetical protein
MSVMAFRSIERRFAAEVVSAGGAVEKQSLIQAITQLIEAVSDDTEDTPYGAVVTAAQEPPQPALVWESVLSARQRIATVIIDAQMPTVSGMDALKLIQWPDDIHLILTSTEFEHAENAQKQLLIGYSSPAATEHDVLLLLTPGKLKELLPSTVSKSPTTERYLLRISARPAAAVARTPTSASADPSDAPDADTLEWRRWFVKHVPTFTAEQIAKQAGHQANNKSATASRWLNDGKIFYVKFQGQLLYPAFQFRHGQPLPIVARMLSVLGDDPTGWDRALFFATPNAYLNNDKPMDRLNDKGLEEKFVSLADRHTHPAAVF